MKYQKKMNLWADGIQDKIITGEIKLQPGQWLECGEGASKPCRYVSHSDRTISVVHWQGSAEKTTRLFMARIESQRMAALYDTDREAWKEWRKSQKSWRAAA